MKYNEIADELRSIENIKTKDVDKYNKKLIKEHADVSDLKKYILEDQLVYRTYFQVSLGGMNSYEAQFKFIEQNEDLLQDWWHVDELLQFIKKPVNFDYAYEKAIQYINSDKLFVRRWGYVIFLMGFQKDTIYTKKILKLLKDDDEYFVQMAEAWLLCDLAVFNTKDVIEFLKTSTIKYSILGKAIQKMCDSFRISKEDKEQIKSLRSKLKQNK